MPRYEELLWEYYQIYRQRYEEDYANLFPEGVPAWDCMSLRQEPMEREKDTPISSIPEPQDQIRGLLAPVEQALRDRELAIAELTHDNQRLLAELATTQNSGRIIADMELRDDCQEFLRSEETCIDAIRRAGVVLEERLRKTVGGKAPEKFSYGLKLVDYALAKDRGRLIISEYAAEQDGVHLLFRGVIQSVRNPPSHKKLHYSVLEAEQTVGLIDYLLSLLQQTTLREGKSS